MSVYTEFSSPRDRKVVGARARFGGPRTAERVLTAEEFGAKCIDRRELAVVILGHNKVTYRWDQLATRDIPSASSKPWPTTPTKPLEVNIDTVRRAKGLDFTAVYLATLWTPHQTRTEEREILRRRQQLVGRTRDRDRLWVAPLQSFYLSSQFGPKVVTSVLVSRVVPQCSVNYWLVLTHHLYHQGYDLSLARR